MPIRMTGMVSGLDTEALVSAMVSAYSQKKVKSQKNVQSLKWKQEAWVDMNKKIKSLYSSVSSLRFSSAYTLKKAVASDPTKATVSAAAGAVTGSQKLVIKQLASSGYLTGAKLSNDTTSSTTLEDLGYTASSGTITVKVGSETKDIEVNGDTKVSDFINSLKEAGVNANYDEANHRIFISSKASGKDNDFVLTGNAGGLEALTSFGVNAESKANTDMYKAYAAYKDMSLDQIKGVLSQIDNNKQDIATLTSDNNKMQDSINYANNYKNAYNTIFATDLSDEKKEKLEEYLSQPSVNLYVGTGENAGKYFDKVEEKKDDDGNVIGYEYTRTYKEDGEDKTETVTVDEKLETITEKVQALAEEDTTGTLKNDKGEPDSKKISELYTRLQAVKNYQADDANAATVTKIKDAYSPLDSTGVDNFVTTEQGKIKANNTDIKTMEAYNKQNAILDTGAYDDAAAESLYEKIQTYAGYLNSTTGFNEGAVRVNGQDAIIELNDAEYTSTTNSFTVNGLTINATGVTGPEGITVTTDSDNQAIYDKIKGFLKQYNELVTEMNRKLNAESAKGYEPLSDEEKEAMTDDQIEKWETKIKDAIFRRDGTLSGVLSAMTTSMSKAYKIGDKTYSLSSFGISTKSYFETDDNDNYEYHIAGDKDDEYSSGKADKLMAAITDDPEGVVDFMKQITEDLYKTLDGKMKKTALSSGYTAYNDVQFSNQLKSYEKEVKKWEEKVTAYEDKWYGIFANMEKSMSKLQSQQSQLAGMMGM